MTKANLHHSSRTTLTHAARILARRLHTFWAAEPVPCWTEYLRETRASR